MSDRFPEHASGCPTDATLRRLEGCDEAAANGGFELETTAGRRARFTRCPLFYVDEELVEFIRAWRFFRRGLFPEGPCFADQSATFLEAVDELELALVGMRDSE